MRSGTQDLHGGWDALVTSTHDTTLVMWPSSYSPVSAPEMALYDEQGPLNSEIRRIINYREVVPGHKTNGPTRSVEP